MSVRSTATIPSGKLRKGLNDVAALVKRLKEIEKDLSDPAQPLIGWGVDPSLNDPIMSITRHDLDQVSKTRPIFLLHASCHIGYVNSKTLKIANYAAIKTPACSATRRASRPASCRRWRR